MTEPARDLQFSFGDSVISDNLKFQRSISNVVSSLKNCSFEIDYVEVNLLTPYVSSTRLSSIEDIKKYQKHVEVISLIGEERIKFIHRELFSNIPDFVNKINFVLSEKKLYQDNWDFNVSNMFSSMVTDIRVKKSENVYVVYVIDSKLFDLNGLDYKDYIPYSNYILV